MQVSLSEAAKMVGITRSTLYTHIKQKGISIINSSTARPTIDVSELIRVYGDKVKPLDQINARKASKTAETEPSLATELAILRERLKTGDIERERERRQLTERIENLQEMLKKEQEAVGKITTLLTDQRTTAEKNVGKEEEQTKRFSEIETAVKALLDLQQQQTPKKSWWRFGTKAS